MKQSLPVILGAGGFLGKRLALALLERGHRVRLFDRTYSPECLSALGNYQDKFELVEGSLESPADREKAIKGASTVFHFVSASVPVTSPRMLDVEIAVNLPNTLALIHTMLQNGVVRIVFPSSGGAVYGESGAGRSKESAPLRPTGAYGMGKLLIEETLRYYRRTFGLEDLILRISNAYGGWERTTCSQGAVDVFMKRHAEGKPIPLWGDGLAVRDYIHVDDIVAAMVLLYERDIHSREFNLGFGVGYSLREVISIIEKVSGISVGIEQMEGGMYTGLQRSVLDPGLLREMTGNCPGVGLEEGIWRCWNEMTVPMSAPADLIEGFLAASGGRIGLY